MIDYKPKYGDMEMWLITVATSNLSKDEKEKQIINPDGTISVKFEVGGIELDFNQVAKRVENAINYLVENKAKELLVNKYASLINELEDIQERISTQKTNVSLW